MRRADKSVCLRKGKVYEIAISKEKAISLGKGSRLLEFVVGSFEICGHEFKESQLVSFSTETLKTGAVHELNPSGIFFFLLFYYYLFLRES